MEAAAKFFTKRNIIIAVALVLVAELVWIGWTVSQRSSKNPTSRPAAASPVISSPTVITLQPDKSSLTIGEKVNVTINISSKKSTDGTDLIMNFDPRFLAIDPSQKFPVVVGTIYSDFPINAADEAQGKIVVSGITSQVGGVVPGDGIFGTITFIAKASGKTAVTLNFTPGNTADSNVVESGTAKDVLTSVNNAEVVIGP